MSIFSVLYHSCQKSYHDILLKLYSSCQLHCGLLQLHHKQKFRNNLTCKRIYYPINSHLLFQQHDGFPKAFQVTVIPVTFSHKGTLFNSMYSKDW